MKKNWLLIGLLVCLANSLPAASPLRIGYMVCNSREETLERFLPLTAFLAEKLGQQVEAVAIGTYDFDKAVSDGKVDIAHTNSYLFFLLQHRYKFKLMLGEEQGLGGTKTASVIFSKKGSGIKALSDLKNKRMVFGPEYSPGGYLGAYDLLLKNNIDPENDLAYYAIPWGAFKHDKILYAVYYGSFDAGVARLGDIEHAVELKLFDKNDFNVVAISDLLPYCTFSAAPKVPQSLVKKITDILLAVNARDLAEVGGERLKVLKRAGLDGFKLVAASEYEKIKEVAKRVKVPPFSEFY